MLTTLFAYGEGIRSLPAAGQVLTFLVFAALAVALGVSVAAGGRRG